jgi:hypothetical protein
MDQSPAFASDCNCCVCGADGHATCSALGCRDAGEGGACQSDKDCSGGQVCAFNPGCGNPVGYCFSSHFCPLYVAQQYCGCDGQTFTAAIAQWPAHPYSHVGACR